jgi:hypothetical protein
MKKTNKQTNKKKKPKQTSKNPATSVAKIYVNILILR